MIEHTLLRKRSWPQGLSALACLFEIPIMSFFEASATVHCSTSFSLTVTDSLSDPDGASCQMGRVESAPFIGHIRWLHALLHKKVASDELARLLGDGAKLTEDEACTMALDD